STAGEGRADRMRQQDHTCSASALTMMPPCASAMASASADLPDAVGPAIRTGRPGSMSAMKSSVLPIAVPGACTSTWLAGIPPTVVEHAADFRHLAPQPGKRQAEQ